MSLPLGKSPEEQQYNFGCAGKRRPAFGRILFAFLGLALAAGVFVLHGVLANQVSSRSDTLSSATISATSNHTIAFTAQNNLASQGGNNGTTASNTVSVTFPSGFNLSAIGCGDVNLGINGTATSLNDASGSTQTTCLNTGTSWGVLIDPTNRVLTLTTPTSDVPWVAIATGTPITISIGSNATFQTQGTHWITNPSSAGIYTVSVGGTFGGSGNILVSINSAVTVQATVAESLSLTISGIASGSCTADDGATVNAIGTTAVSVPFGTINANSFYIGCQDLAVSTNAGGGYSLTALESNPLMTSNGLYSIPAADVAPSDEEGHVTVGGSVPEGNSLKEWVHPEFPQVAVAPKTEFEFRFTVDVPKDADPGTHYGVLLVSTAPATQGAGAAVQAKIGPIILAKVLGDITEKLTLESLTMPRFQEVPPIAIEARFKNEGTVHEAPSGDIEVRNMFGALVATGTLPERNVLPGVVRKVEASVGDGLWFGRYTVFLHATYGDGSQRLETTRTIWVIPWRTQGWKVLIGVAFASWVIVARRRFRAFWYVLKTGLPPPEDL